MKSTFRPFVVIVPTRQQHIYQTKSGINVVVSVIVVVIVVVVIILLSSPSLESMHSRNSYYNEPDDSKDESTMSNPYRIWFQLLDAAPASFPGNKCGRRYTSFRIYYC